MGLLKKVSITVCLSASMLMQSLCFGVTALQKDALDFSGMEASLSYQDDPSSPSSDAHNYSGSAPSALNPVVDKPSALEQLSDNLQNQSYSEQSSTATRQSVQSASQISSALQRLQPTSKSVVLGNVGSQAGVSPLLANPPNTLGETHPASERPNQNANEAGLKTPQGYVALSPGVYVPQSYLASSSISAFSPGFSSSSGFSSVAFLGHLNSPQAVQSVLSKPAALINSNLEFPRYPLLSAVPVTSVYGIRWGRLHAGVDLGTQIGTPVVASLTGQVIFQGEFGGYGKAVILLHQNGTVETLYGHLSEILVRNGQSVRQGEVIARSGNTGHSTGPHLHFEMRHQVKGAWRSIDTNKIVARSAQLLRSGQTVAVISPVSNSQWAAPSPFPSPLVEMRVLLKITPSVQISASTPALITSMDGRVINLMPAMRNRLAQSTPSGIQVNGELMPTAVIIQPQLNGLVSIDNHWYRGRVALINRPSGLVVINWVDLEQYISSVVGSEAYPSWHIDALKAQAIAARSYALTFRYRPVSTWYDLAAGPQYQAYNGVSSEFNTTVQATSETRGLVLTNKGSVVEAQYASTQAMTDAYHDGFGMSQWGAAALADKGHSYLAILQKYYPGTLLSRIVESSKVR